MEHDELNSLLCKLKLGLSEKYEKLDNNQFKCNLKVLEIECEGIGKSKKKAKLEATKNILPYVRNIRMNNFFYHRTRLHDLKHHPCRLVEYLMQSRNDPSPSYSIKQTPEGEFICEMFIRPIDKPFIGKGKSKKEAKENAALMLMEHIKIVE